MTSQFALTAAQVAVWIRQRLALASAGYNAAEAIELRGPLDLLRFERALRQAVAECDAVHARFAESRSGVVQLLELDVDAWPFEIVAVNSLEAVEQWMRADLRRLVDLREGPLFRHVVFVLGADHHIWYHRCHHIALDGYGFALLAQRAAQLYVGVAHAEPFGPLRTVVEEELAYQSSAQHEVDREFWHSYLADCPAPVTLSGTASFTGGGSVRRSGLLAMSALEYLASAAGGGANWAGAVLGVVATHLGRRQGADEVVLGVPVMGRLGSAAARIPAMIVNVVPVRVRVDHLSVTRTIRTASAQLRQIGPHRRYRAEQLRRELGRLGGTAALYGPVVNVMPFDRHLDFASCTARVRNVSAAAEFVEDMAIHVSAQGAIDIDANPHCYDPDALTASLSELTAMLTQAEKVVL
jgi:nonribosomal peptide synthetase MxcG